MKPPVFIALAATGALIALGGWLLASKSETASAPTKADSASVAAGGSSASTSAAHSPGLAPQNVLAIRPRAPAAPASAQTAFYKGIDAATPYKESALAKMAADGVAGKVLLAQIEHMGSDAEALLMKADILAGCAEIKDDKWRAFAKGTKMETDRNNWKVDPRGEYLKSLSATTPNREARIAAFDRLNVSGYCEGLREIEVTNAELFDLRKQAAAAGNANAQAQLLSCELNKKNEFDPNESFRDSMVRREKQTELTTDQQQSLFKILKSGNPKAIQTAMGLMWNSYGNVRLDLPNGLSADSAYNMQYTHHLGELLSCDFGARCAAAEGARAMNWRCAYQGQCDVQTVADAIHFHELSPAHAQKTEAMREVFRNAIASGDFSQIKFVPNDMKSNNYSFSSGTGRFNCP